MNVLTLLNYINKLDYKDACEFIKNAQNIKTVTVYFSNYPNINIKRLFLLFMFFYFPSDTLYSDKPNHTYAPFEDIIKTTVHIINSKDENISAENLYLSIQVQWELYDFYFEKWINIDAKIQIDKLIDEYLVFQVEPDNDCELTLKFIKNNLKFLKYNDKTGLQILEERINESPPLSSVLQNQLDVMHRAYSDTIFEELYNNNFDRIYQGFDEIKALLIHFKLNDNIINNNIDITSDTNNQNFCKLLLNELYKITNDTDKEKLQKWFTRLQSYYIDNPTISQIKFIADFIPKYTQILIDIQQTSNSVNEEEHHEKNITTF